MNNLLLYKTQLHKHIIDLRIHKYFKNLLNLFKNYISNLKSFKEK